MWRVCKDAGRAWPVLSDDDVIDYMVMEAVALKAQKADAKARKEQEKRQWQEEQRKALQKQYT